MTDCTFGMPGSVHWAMDMIDSMNIEDKVVLDVFKTLSVLAIDAVLTGLPEIEDHSLGDLFREFQCKPLHVFSLGVPIPLTNYKPTTFCGENICTSAMTISTSASRAFKQGEEKYSPPNEYVSTFYRA